MLLAATTAPAQVRDGINAGTHVSAGAVARTSAPGTVPW